MSASSVKIAITPMSGSVTTCKPNLMPFHINYNGPAPVNAFMHVDKLVADVGSAADVSELQVQTDKLPQGAKVYPAIASAISTETQCLHASTSSDTFDGPLTLNRTTTESTLVTEGSSATLGSSTSDMSLPTKSQDLAPPIEDFDERFISTFRGRSIHGLTINLPDGYAGLVLKATSDRADGTASCATGTGDVQKTKDVDVDVEMESLGQRRRGWLRSSAAPRKGTVITISDDENADQSPNLSNPPEEHYGSDVDMGEPLSTPNELDGPLRILVPTARFDSFTLWQADRTVNKSNDEYWRALTEWIGLAHEIHNVDV